MKNIVLGNIHNVSLNRVLKKEEGQEKFKSLVQMKKTWPRYKNRLFHISAVSLEHLTLNKKFPFMPRFP